MIDPDTQKAIDDAEKRAKDFATGLKAEYAKTDTAWQKLRREHPLAVQNVAIGLLAISLAVNAWQYFRPLAA